MVTFNAWELLQGEWGLPADLQHKCEAAGTARAHSANAAAHRSFQQHTHLWQPRLERGMPAAAA